MATYDLVGKKEVIIGEELFAPELVSDDLGSITLTAATTEISSQQGTVNIPNGSFEEMSATITLIVPDVATLARIFPGNAQIAKFTHPGKTDPGVKVSFGSNECKTIEPVPIIIRNACDTNSAQDIRMPRAIVANSAEFEFSIGDPITVELQIAPLPSEDGTVGAVEFGEGDLAAPSYFDVTTGVYKTITEQS